MTVMVVGGCGYIGSHTVVELLRVGHDVAIVDNLSNSSSEVLNRIHTITGKVPAFFNIDVRDTPSLIKAFSATSCSDVIHFAGLKSVGDSVSHPLEYYDNNVAGTISLLKAMQSCNLKSLIFSSSATVYGVPEYLPIDENHRLQATNPYGRTKLHTEELLRDLFVGDSDWKICILRYFNPVGAHESSLIGEDPRVIPNNLLPFVAQVAVGRYEFVRIFGDDYNTLDGTGVRDFVHVVDLAAGHSKALAINNKPHCTAINLGTGKGYSVYEAIAKFSEVSGRPISVQVHPRRAGDVAECYADCMLAEDILGWSAKRDLTQMCADAWEWQTKNPNGYKH